MFVRPHNRIIRYQAHGDKRCRLLEGQIAVSVNGEGLDLAEALEVEIYIMDQPILGDITFDEKLLN